MSFNYGEKLKISVFGQSHSEAIGVTIDGLPVGLKIDFDKVNEFMQKRRPGANDISTPRSEADTPKIISGLVDGITCGSPLCAIIENTNTRSKDYDKIKNIPRPSHSDYPAYVKYKGFNDIRGGGHFSARLTAPICFAGAICNQILESKGIEIGAQIISIGKVNGEKFKPICTTKEDLKQLKSKEFQTINDNAQDSMRAEILNAKSNGDSVGGVIECCVLGLECGIGEPIFDSVESRLSSAMFSIPAVKGIEFGNGFDSCSLFGSENNDEYYYEDEVVKTKTNNSGGITGGITNGMPLLFSVGFKPTSSISKEQNSIDLTTKKNTKLIIEGRHDPCIVPRAVPCVEAMTAIVLTDLILWYGDYYGFK